MSSVQRRTEDAPPLPGAGDARQSRVEARHCPQNGRIAVKTARGARACAMLRHEAAILRRLPTGIAPRLIGLNETAEGTELISDWIDGPPLGDLPPEMWSLVLDAVAERLSRVHEAGIVHSDLAPRNIVCGRSGPVLVDWESARVIGEPVGASPSRSISIGWSHPDLIWGRGPICPRLDDWPLAQMRDEARTRLARPAEAPGEPYAARHG